MSKENEYSAVQFSFFLSFLFLNQQLIFPDCDLRFLKAPLDGSTSQTARLLAPADQSSPGFYFLSLRNQKNHVQFNMSPLYQAPPKH